MSDPETPAKSGQPIAAHLAVLVAIALAAAYVVNLVAVVMLPPRPPDVMRGDKVLEAFTAGYAIARTGRTPPTGDGAKWTIQKQKPRVAGAPRAGRIIVHDLARRLETTPQKVVVAFDATPTDVVVFRVRSEEFRVEHEKRRADGEKVREMHLRARASREGESRVRREVIISENGDVTLRAPNAPRPPHAGVEAPMPPQPPNAVTEQPVRIAPRPPEPPEPPEPPRFAPPPPGVVLMSGFLVAAEMADGRWLVMRQQSNAETLDWIMRAALGIGATLVILLLLALLFARRLAAPIQRFAEAARRVGIDVGEAPVKEEGPRELRTAARAVNAMQGRLRSLVAERTEMLAAVAHDLRTPLMRLRLAAENADPALRDKLAKETGEIDAMVSSFIAFARDDPTREARVKLDLAALLQSAVDDRTEAGQDVTYEGPDRLVVMGQAVGLKRLVENLIDNALKYGRVARVAMRQDGADVCIDVTDEGPGIPREEREKVFRPFVRGEGATGAGAGLGLAAAREIARAHGGDVEIRDGQPRGALVRVTLPV
ncbi:MAG: ATP-binding protein [Alphaproteobacteria bacterium]|nr:ATP-binding protein [Alphaproteobacteria bacterium]